MSWFLGQRYLRRQRRSALSDRSRFNGLTQFQTATRNAGRQRLNRKLIDVDSSTPLACAIIRCSTARKPLILKRPAPSERSESRGEMSEWLKEHAWKACVGETLPWVRIPLSPPAFAPSALRLGQPFGLAMLSTEVI